MKQCIKEQNELDIDEQLEAENKKAEKLIKYLKDNRANNEDARAEFAKIVFELALSYSPIARKFVKKLSQFCEYWGDDSYISEEEWHKLNNSEEL